MIGAQYGLLAQYRLAKKLEEDARKRREEEKKVAEAEDSKEE
ncbi:MAG TPA: hypothetical protein VMW26_03825 [Methanomassiliicoccales archaeon]|nr:hypothetical protein [Methanomassiliicoccales archaeon]